MNQLQTAEGVLANAATTILETGVIGALLILSIAANAALVWALVRAYRFQRGGGSNEQH